MKVRSGFVSNSSSSSFVIRKDELSKAEKYIVEHYTDLPSDGFGDPEEWCRQDMGHVYYFETMMDNYDLRAAFQDFGIVTHSNYHSNGYYDEEDDYED